MLSPEKCSYFLGSFISISCSSLNVHPLCAMFKSQREVYATTNGREGRIEGKPRPTGRKNLRKATTNDREGRIEGKPRPRLHVHIEIACTHGKKNVQVHAASYLEYRLGRVCRFCADKKPGPTGRKNLRKATTKIACTH